MSEGAQVAEDYTLPKLVVWIWKNLSTIVFAATLFSGTVLWVDWVNSSINEHGTRLTKAEALSSTLVDLVSRFTMVEHEQTSNEDDINRLDDEVRRLRNENESLRGRVYMLELRVEAKK